jgi:hypothetical protein
MDIDVGLLILFCVLAWIASQIILGIMDAYHAIKVADRMEFLKKLNDSIHQVKVEKHGNMEYWFDQHSDEFLGQGKTLEEIAKVLKSRFPTHLFLLDGRGGIAEQTNWKLMNPEEFNKLTLSSKDLV